MVDRNELLLFLSFIHINHLVSTSILISLSQDLVVCVFKVVFIIDVRFTRRVLEPTHFMHYLSHYMSVSFGAVFVGFAELIPEELVWPKSRELSDLKVAEKD